METQFTYIVELAKKYNAYNNDSALLYEAINQLSESELQDIWDEYGNPKHSFKPVNLLRAEVVDKLRKGEAIDEIVVEEIKDKIRTKDIAYFAHCPQKLLDELKAYKLFKRDLFANWQQPWSVFHTYFYRGQTKDTVDGYLPEIACQLQQDLNLFDYDIHTKGFQGSNNFGKDWAWLALYPLSKYSHRDGYQFFLKLDAMPVAGRKAGHGIVGEKSEDLAAVNSYAEVLIHFSKIKEITCQLNDSTTNYFQFTPGLQATEWESFYSQQIAAVSDDEFNVGDITTISSLKTLNLRAGLPEDSQNEQIKNLWLFKEANVGDVVFAVKGVNTVVGIGIISGEYFYTESNSHYKHSRKV
ncbi:MAG: hypothetical protein AAF639_30530, partial [Chloroflexota bacterium]